MARPPSTAPAPTDAASYMREYRAWKAGRGAYPGGRVEWAARRAETLDDLERARRLEDAETAWRTLRLAVLDQGGILPNADYGPTYIPRPVLRRSGLSKPADVMAAVLGFESDYDLMEALNVAWERVDRARKSRGAVA